MLGRTGTNLERWLQARKYLLWVAYQHFQRAMLPAYTGAIFHLPRSPPKLTGTFQSTALSAPL